MSNKPLQSIKFPGLADTYTIENDIENFASAYSTSSTYQVGEYVTYDGAFYVCTTAISTAEAWTPAHWTQVTVGEELSHYKAEINQLSGQVNETIDVDFSTAISGKYIGSNGVLSSDSNYGLTQPINLKAGQTVTLNARGYSTSISMISQYDGQIYSPLVKSIDGTDRTYTYTATEPLTVVLSYNQTQSYSAQIISSISSAIADIYAQLGKIGAIQPIDFSTETVGSYIDYRGVLSSGSTYAMTQPIALRKGQAVTMKGKGYLTNISMISRFNGADSYTKLVLSNTSDVAEYTYTATEDMQIVLSYGKSMYHNGFVISSVSSVASGIYDRVDSIDTIISNAGLSTPVDFSTAVTGKYISSTGSLENSSSFSMTQPTSVVAGQSISFTARGYLTNIAMIAQYTGGTTHTPIVLSVDSTVREYTYTFKEPMQIVLSYRNDYAYSATLTALPLDMVEQSISQSNLFGHGVLFPRLAVIGDSLSSGHVQGGGDVYGDSWLSFIARKINATARTHYSEGGLTCKTWLTNYRARMESDTAFNAYFIALGHNDNFSQPYPLGSINDPAGTDSFVGYYKQIIEAVQAHAPYAVIFCVSLYNNSSSHQAYSDMIEDICELYTGTFYIDYVGNGKIYTTTGGVWTADSHFTTVGYNYVAGVIYDLVCKCVDEHLNYFKVFGLHNSVGEKYNEEPAE